MTLFGYTLRNLRKRKKVSLAEMAEALGLRTINLENMESGYITPDDETAKVVAAYFGVTVGYMRGSVEVTLQSKENESLRTETPERFVKLRPVPADIFEDGELRQEADGARDIILPVPSGDASTYIAVRWTDNTMRRYRVEAGDILIIRENPSSVRNGNLVLVITPDKKALLRRYYREGGEVLLRSDDDDMLLPIKLRMTDESYQIIGVVTEIMVEVTEDFLKRCAHNPPLLPPENSGAVIIGKEKIKCI